MSFYRSLAVAVAAMGLTVSAFAADDAAQSPAQSPVATQAQADNSAAPAATMTTASNDATAQQPGTADAATTDASKLDINKASVRDLKKIKGISANKARAIVAYRKKHGDFKSLDELKEVKGFKKMNDQSLQDIQNQLTTG